MFIPFLIFGILGGLLGGALASFLGVVSSRAGTGEGIGGRSHCVCGRQLTWWQMIPVLGYLLSGGRDRKCGSSIPVVYFISEAISFTAGFLVAWTGISYLSSRGTLGSFALAIIVLIAALTLTYVMTRPTKGAEEVNVDAP